MSLKAFLVKVCSYSSLLLFYILFWHWWEIVFGSFSEFSLKYFHKFVNILFSSPFVSSSTTKIHAITPLTDENKFEKSENYFCQWKKTRNFVSLSFMIVYESKKSNLSKVVFASRIFSSSSCLHLTYLSSNQIIDVMPGGEVFGDFSCKVNRNFIASTMEFLHLKYLLVVILVGSQSTSLIFPPPHLLSFVFLVN